MAACFASRPLLFSILERKTKKLVQGKLKAGKVVITKVVIPELQMNSVGKRHEQNFSQYNTQT